MHKLKYKNHFYLLGYEYGVLIVLEIAAILESYGELLRFYHVQAYSMYDFVPMSFVRI